MSNRIFIDTLFVIALINRRDQYHQQALDLAEQFEGYPLFVTDAVLLEIGNALARSYKQEAVAIIEQFLAAEEIDSLSTWQPIQHWQPHSDLDDHDLEAEGWRWRDDTQTLLEDFVKLVVEEFTDACYKSVANFVKKWGLLWVCRNASHGECYPPRLHLGPWDTNPCSWAPIEEVKEFWRLAWELKAVLEINAALQQERPVNRKLLQHLRLFKTTDLPLDPSGLKIAY